MAALRQEKCGKTGVDNFVFMLYGHPEKQVKNNDEY